MSVISMCHRQVAYALPRAGFNGRTADSPWPLRLATGGVLLAIMAAVSPANARTAAFANVYDETGGAMSMWGQPLVQLQAPQRSWHRAARGRPSETGSWSSEGSFAAPRFDAPSSGSSEVLNEASRWVGHGNVTGSHRAWCADFANFVLSRTGHHASGSGMVNSLLGVGPRVATPSAGDLVVMRNHVTIFAGYSGHGFYGLGGNQHHRVAMSNFPLRSVVAFVRPN
jgi:uncharacterized protein (TIGR02594 family)